jgi:hypothetical protein
MTNAWTPYKIDHLAELLTERDGNILEDVERFRLLNTRLIQRRHFPASIIGGHATVSAATRGTTRVLGRLEGHGFISRLERRVGGIKHGSAGTVWQLAAAGERYLRAQRGDADRRRFVEPSTAFMSHTLDVAYLATRLIEHARTGQFELLELETEPDCWRDFQSASGTALMLKPDLFVITADSEFEIHSFVEVDRGTEHLPAILRKCQTYQHYWRTGTEQHTRNLFPAVIWVTTTTTRAEKIAAAIRGAPDLTPDLFHTVTAENALSVLATESSPTFPKGGTQ